MKQITAALLIILFMLLPCMEEASTRQPLHAKNGMVACTREAASRIGVDILKKGGNAVDAAVAVALALAVAWPRAGNIGGGGFMIVRSADGSSEVIDYRETAPAAASHDMYLDSRGDVVPDLSIYGYLASGVPGTVAGLELAWQRHGKLPWKELVEPARKLAADGVVIDSVSQETLKYNSGHLSKYPETNRIFLRNGNLYAEGEMMRQPDLAATLQRIQVRGAREFYEGETARLIAKDMQANGGLITAEDLKNYKPVIREPLRGTYRGYELITAPPPSSAGIALLEMFNILELQDVKALGYHSADHIHLVIESMKRAFADRAGLLGDPDFVKVPLDRLVSKEYARELRNGIDMRKATPSSDLTRKADPDKESNDTTHFSIVDREGNIVSNTFTLNGSFGSCVTIPGTGILMNNEMDDFTSKPGVPNLYGLLQSEKNAIQPKKRPLSAMAPTIVLKDGKPYLLVGTPGGPTIISTVLQVSMNVIDFGMNLQQAVDEPRFHHQWMPDVIFVDPFGISPDTRSILEQRGHKFSKKYFYDDTDYFGDAEAILIDPETGVYYGASDTRLAGYPAGY
jgi:gamma-glutamyltranspeptidase / glutathione hydrolase